MKKFKKCKNSAKLKKNIATKVKRRRIHKKITLIHYSLKEIDQIKTPHNTTQYIIENKSSPFFYDDSDEEGFDINVSLNPFLKIDTENMNSFPEGGLNDSYPDYELPSTVAQSFELRKYKCPGE